MSNGKTSYWEVRYWLKSALKKYGKNPNHLHSRTVPAVNHSKACKVVQAYARVHQGDTIVLLSVKEVPAPFINTTFSSVETPGPIIDKKESG